MLYERAFTKDENRQASDGNEASFSPGMKHNEQVDAARTKMRYTAYLNRRVFRHLSPEVFLRAFTALVRPVLEDCIRA